MLTTETITPLIRKLAVLILVITLIAMVEYVPSFAVSKATTGEAVATVDSKDGAVIRKSFSILSKRIRVLNHSDSFVITSVRYAKKNSMAKRNIWYYSRELKGYIRSDLVKVSYVTRGSAKTKKKIVMRKGAGTAFKKVKTLNKSAKLTVYLSATDSKGKKWLKVKSGGKTGFVRSSGVRLVAAKKSTASSKGNADEGQDRTRVTAAEQSTVTGFPATYSSYLNRLKAAHPNWEFVPVKTGLDWNQALDKMTARSSVNTIYYSFGMAYRSTEKGDYDYLTDTYTRRDGNRFYSASKQAVAYYMDPRNFMDDSHIFMFEDHAFNMDYQTLLTVQAIFKGRNNTLYKNAGYFIKAGKKYDISPIYLAAKALGEQGSGINSGKISGKRVYNVFNIGAYDSASGGTANGVKFAGAKGSYQRPWTSVKKAIYGGAQYISENFSTKKQNSGYLEHFNVLNGLSNVGTHIYMTAVYSPSNKAVMTYNNYKKYGILKSKFIFYIPVFENMPKSPCPKPRDGKVDNNYYLRSLTVNTGKNTKKLVRASALNYKTTFTVKVDSDVKSIVIKADPSGKTGASVTGTGTKKVSTGKETFKVVCRSSSGLKRTYKIRIERS